MNRRKFLKFITAISAALAVGATTVTIEGCTFNITDAINTVLNSALAILKVAEPNASWAGPIANAIAALQQAETQWQSGGAAAIVIDALNTIEAVCAVIPVTAAYSPLIDILIAGIEAVMAAFGLTTQLSPAAMAKRPTVTNSPHYGKVAIKTSFAHPTFQGAYKHLWNSTAQSLKLAVAEIK